MEYGISNDNRPSSLPGPKKRGESRRTRTRTNLQSRIYDQRNPSSPHQRMTRISIRSRTRRAKENTFVTVGGEMFEQSSEGSGDTVHLGKEVFYVVRAVIDIVYRGDRHKQG